MKQKSLALFDFDGTMTKHDSLWLFLKYYFGVPQLYLKILPFLPQYIAYKLGLQSNSTAKEKLFKRLFAGTNLEFFNSKCKDFVQQVLVHYLKTEALNKIVWHQQRGDEIVIVSASLESYLIYISADLNVELIATQIETNENQITGNFRGNNCTGPEKVKRILKEYKLAEFEEIHVYGDSKGDHEMLGLASHAYYKHFKN